MPDVPHLREKEKRRYVLLSTILHASHTQAQAKWPEVINVTAFKNCCRITALPVGVLKLLFSPKALLDLERLEHGRNLANSQEA